MTDDKAAAELADAVCELITELEIWCPDETGPKSPFEAEWARVRTALEAFPEADWRARIQDTAGDRNISRQEKH